MGLKRNLPDAGASIGAQSDPASTPPARLPSAGGVACHDAGKGGRDAGASSMSPTATLTMGSPPRQRFLDHGRRALRLTGDQQAIGSVHQQGNQAGVRYPRGEFPDADRPGSGGPGARRPRPGPRRLLRASWPAFEEHHAILCGPAPAALRASARSQGTELRGCRTPAGNHGSPALFLHHKTRTQLAG